MRIISDYFSSFRSFTRNAKLYLLAALIAGIANSMFSVVYNLYLKELGFGPEFPGLITSLTNLAAVFLALPAGRFCDLTGSRRLMIIGFALAIPFSLGRALAISRSGLLFNNFMVGCASTITQVTIYPFLTQSSTPSERTHLFSISSAMGVAAGVIGSYLGGALPSLMASLFGWAAESAESYRLTFVAATILLAFSIFPILLIRESQKRQGSACQCEPEHDPGIESLPEKRWPEQAPQWTQKVKAIFSRKAQAPAPIPKQALNAISWFGLSQFLIGLGAGLFVSFMNLFMSDVLKLSAAEIGMWMAVSALTQALGILAAPRIAQLFGKVRTIIGCQCLSIPFLLILAFLPLPGLAIFAFLMRTMLMNMNNGIFNVLAMETVGENGRGLMSGVLSMVFSLGWVIGPYVGGNVIENYGYTPVFVAGALLYITATSLFWLRFRNLEKSAESNQDAVISA